MTIAAAAAGAHVGSVSYGPVLNTAAMLLTAFGNVRRNAPPHLIGLLLRMPVSADFADKAGERLSGRLEDAGFDEVPGAPHVLVIRTPARNSSGCGRWRPAASQASPRCCRSSPCSSSWTATPPTSSYCRS